MTRRRRVVLGGSIVVGVVVGFVAVLAVEITVAGNGVHLEEYEPHLADGMVNGDGPDGGRPPLRITWLGDSTAAGVGSSGPQRAVSHQVAERLGRPVDLDVLAISGARIQDVLEKQVAKVAADTDLVIISVGANDTTHVTSSGDFRERYRAVMDAYLAGLEAAEKAGHDLNTIHSVASFFVSRVDTEIDKRLEAIGSDEALALRGQAGVANARLAYAAYEEVFVGGRRFTPLAEAGAWVQRPLWASTGVKNPDYSDTLYVTELVAPNTVNTMPEKTIDAVADHGVIKGDTISGTAGEAQQVFDRLEDVGIDLRDVFLVLEDEGVEKFEKSWQELLDATQGQLDDKSK